MTTAPQPYSAWNVDEYKFPPHGTLGEKLNFLLNYAILAPSLHNTQPWKFAVHGDIIRVFADGTHHLLVSDPDARELYISVGCAMENLLTASTYFGLRTRVTHFPDLQNGAWIATISFSETSVTASLADRECFHAIPLRHTNRHTYANKPLNDRDIFRLRGCLHKENITLQLTDNSAIKQAIDGLVISADITQFADPDYRDELNQWIAQGEFGYRWLIARMGQLATTYVANQHKTIKPDADIVLNAPVLALLSTNSDDRLAQIKIGQVFERIALNATALNIGIQPLSQILQVRELKLELSKLFTQGAAFPQMIFRIGYTDVAQDATTRKQLDSVVIP